MAASRAAASSSTQGKAPAGPSYQALRQSSLGSPVGAEGLLSVGPQSRGSSRTAQLKVVVDPKTGKRTSLVSGDGEPKDYTKGCTRICKKVSKACDYMHNYFGIPYYGELWLPALTIETLEDAVRDPDREQVERMLEHGVNPNEPIDEFGYTILDALAVEQLQMISDCLEQRSKGLSSADLTQMFKEHEEGFFEVMSILKQHGAKMRGDAEHHGHHVH